MILVDTGVFVAAADRDETEHRRCGDLLRTRQGLAVTAPVIPEAAWIIESRFGPAAESRFLSVVTGDRFDIVDLNADDYRCAIDLIDRYADLGLGFVDASTRRSSPRRNDSTSSPSPPSTTATSRSSVRPTPTPSNSSPDHHPPRRWCGPPAMSVPGKNYAP